MLLLLVALFVAACSAGPSPAATPSAGVDDRALQLQRLRTAVDRVAQAQTDADAAVFAVLDLVRAVDSTVPGMLEADSIDQSLAAWKSSGAVVEVGDEAPDLRRGYLTVAEEVDAARTALATARARLDDPWERRYLTAQDDVLTAVRSYAESGDRLAQLLQRHWQTYAWFHAELQSFAERRWQFRSSQEAADAFFVESDRHLDDLQRAQQQMTSVRSERERAASGVNDASAQADEVWRQRPSDQPTPAPGDATP
jgi:hypothetical protein